MIDVYTIFRYCFLGLFGNKDGGWFYLGVVLLIIRLKMMLLFKGSFFIGFFRAEQRGCIRGGSFYFFGCCFFVDLSFVYCYDFFYCFRMVIKRFIGGFGRRGQGLYVFIFLLEKVLSIQIFVMFFLLGFWFFLVNQIGCRLLVSLVYLFYNKQKWS